MDKRETTYILIATGFDLVQVAVWTAHIRAKGCPVAIVGLTAGTLRSTNGVRWVPDLDLDQVTGRNPRLVLLPGGRACAAALVRDPRVMRFIGGVRQRGGQVAGDGEVGSSMSDAEMLVIPPLDAGGRVMLDDLIAFGGGEGRGRSLPIQGEGVEAPGMIGGS